MPTIHIGPTSPAPQIGVSVYPGNGGTGSYGAAATPSAVNPDEEPTGQSSAVGLPWPTDGGTIYIEVIGTGHFSVYV
jgi:hypothetical protein